MNDSGAALSFGQTLNGFDGGDFAANARGDVAFFGTSGLDRMVMVHKADGTDKLAAITSDRSPEDDWFIGYNGISLSDIRCCVLYRRGLERRAAAD